MFFFLVFKHLCRFYFIWWLCLAKKMKGFWNARKYEKIVMALDAIHCKERQNNKGRQLFTVNRELSKGVTLSFYIVFKRMFRDSNMYVLRMVSSVNSTYACLALPLITRMSFRLFQMCANEYKIRFNY